MQRLLKQSFCWFGLTKFRPDINEQVLSNTAPHLHPPQVISTEEREKFRAENKIKFKRNPADLNENWVRDHHNRVFT